MTNLQQNDPFEAMIDNLVLEGKNNLLAEKKKLKMKMSFIDIAIRRINYETTYEQKTVPEDLPKGNQNQSKK